MFMQVWIASFVLSSTFVVAADRPAIPEKSIARKKELLFSDDFEGTEPAKVWHKVVPTFVIENGAIKGTQTRDKDIEATGGKPAIKAHAAVHGLRFQRRTALSRLESDLKGQL